MALGSKRPRGYIQLGGRRPGPGYDGLFHAPDVESQMLDTPGSAPVDDIQRAENASDPNSGTASIRSLR